MTDQTPEQRLYDAFTARDFDTVERILASGVSLDDRPPGRWVTQGFVTGGWYWVWRLWKAGAVPGGMPIVIDRIAAWERGDEPPPEPPKTPQQRLYEALKAKELDTVEKLLTSGIQLDSASPSGMDWLSDVFCFADWYHVWLAWKAGAPADDAMPAVRERVAAWARGDEPPPAPPGAAAGTPDPAFDHAVDASFRLQDLPVAAVRLSRDDDVLSGDIAFQPGHLDGDLTTLRLELADLPFDADALDAGDTVTVEGDDGMSGGDSGYEGSISLGGAHHHVDVTRLVLTPRDDGQTDVDATFALQLESEGIGVPNQSFAWRGTVSLGA